MPWPDFTAELLSLYEPPLRARSTHSMMKYTLDMLAAAGAANTGDLTVSVIARFVRSRPTAESPRTTNAHLRRARAACNFAVAMGRLQVSPFAVRPVGSWIRLGRPEVKHHHSREEIRRVLALLARDVEAARGGWTRWYARRVQAVTTLVAFTGLRRNEALFLWLEDLDLDARVVWVRDRRRLKCVSAAQPVPLPAAAVPVLSDWMAHRLDRPPGFKLPESVPWVFPNVHATNAWSEGITKPLDVLRGVGDRAGVKQLGFHSLRRSLATNLEASGLSQPVITRILRHTSESITRTWYQGMDLPSLNRSVEGFDF